LQKFDRFPNLWDGFMEIKHAIKWDKKAAASTAAFLFLKTV